MKHISDSERLTIAALNRRETELKQANETIEEYKAQLRAMKTYIWELRESNKILSAQVQYLVSKQNAHA